MKFLYETANAGFKQDMSGKSSTESAKASNHWNAKYFLKHYTSVHNILITFDNQPNILHLFLKYLKTIIN